VSAAGAATEEVFELIIKHIELNRRGGA